jgi:hypothetical protein
LLPTGQKLPGTGRRAQLAFDYWYKASAKSSYVFSLGVDASVQEYGADDKSFDRIDYYRRQASLAGSYVFRY